MVEGGCEVMKREEMKTVSRPQGKKVAGAEWCSSDVPSIAAGQLALVLKKNVGMSRGKSDWSAAVAMETECNPMREGLMVSFSVQSGYSTHSDADTYVRRLIRRMMR